MVILVRWSHCLQLFMTAPPRISTKFGFYTQMLIIYCILEIDKHERKRVILRFKAQPFFVVVQLKIRYSMRHKLVGYKVLMKCFQGKLNVSLFIS